MDVMKVQGLTRNSASKNGIETRQISKIRGDADKKNHIKQTTKITLPSK